MLVEALGQLAQAVVDGIDALELPARLLQMGVEAADLGLDLLEVVALQAPGDVLEGNRQAPFQFLHAHAKGADRLVGIDAGDGPLQTVGDIGEPALQPGTAHAAAGDGRRGRWPASIVRQAGGPSGFRATQPRSPRRPASAPRPSRRSQGSVARLRGGGGAPTFGLGRRHLGPLWARVMRGTRSRPASHRGRSKRIGVGFGRAGERRAQCCLGRGHQLESSWSKVAIRRKVSVKKRGGTQAKLTATNSLYFHAFERKNVVLTTST